MTTTTRQNTGEQPTVAGVSGSRRDGSYARRALQEIISGVEDAGGNPMLLDLATLNLPTLDPDLDSLGDSEVVTRTTRDADAVILGTPMYHGSYSGVLKNALDYCSFDEFEDTTVGLLVVSGGPFPTPALDHLRAVCRSLNAWVLPYQAAIPQARSVFNGDDLVDENLGDRVRTLGHQIVEYAVIEPNRYQVVRSQEV